MNTNAEKLDDDEDEFELEIVDDTPEPDRDKARRPEGAEPELPEDEELSGYSETVQKRIKRLKYEFHEERRAKEEASRLRDEAINFAQKEREEKTRLQRMLQEGEGVLVQQAKQRLTVQLAQAKQEFKTAYESGDPDAMAEAQAKLSDLKNEEFRINSFRPATPSPQAQQPSVPAPRPVVQQPSSKAVEWKAKNGWFMQAGNEDMTALAIGTHEKLLRSGVAPESEEYYAGIDGAVRRAFADRFADAPSEVSSQRRQTGNVVAGAGRSSAQTPRTKVTLTSTQVALAKRLGLTPQQYAAQMIKDQSNGN